MGGKKLICDRPRDSTAPTDKGSFVLAYLPKEVIPTLQEGLLYASLRFYNQTWLVKHANKMYAYERESSVSFHFFYPSPFFESMRPKRSRKIGKNTSSTGTREHALLKRYKSTRN